MMSLIVTQLFLLAAAYSGWRSLQAPMDKPWPSLLTLLALLSSLLLLPNMAYSSAESAAAAGLLSCALWLPLNHWLRLPLTGALASLAAAVLLLPLWLPAVSSATPSGLDWLSLLHILAAALAVACFSLAAWQSLAVVWLSQQLKQHKLAAYAGAGSLEHNEKAWLKLTQLAWVAVLLAILSGLPAVYDVLSQHLSHKIFFAVLAWLLLSSVLLGRRFRGWRDKTAARWVLGGWAALLLAWLGTKIVLERLA